MTVIWLLWLPVTLAAPKIFPLVDPGLFVISGVKTCGGGGGYCLLGLDCTLDEDFLPDNGAGQHCDGLKSAFTPSAHFVCCRATNNTAYKPPAAFPSVIATAHTEPMTARTTTLNILENEIDQVLQKVAQSVDSLKKVPATEASFQSSDDPEHTLEIHESVEGDEEEEEIDEGEGDEMVADSPIELWQETSAEDDDQDDGITGVLEENNDTKVPNKPLNNSLSMTVSLDQTPKIEEYVIEKSSEENTISPEDTLNGSEAEEDSNKSSDEYIANESSQESIPQESAENNHDTLYDNSSQTAQEDSQININTTGSNNIENNISPQDTKENKLEGSVIKEEITQMSTAEISKSTYTEATSSPIEDTSIYNKHNEETPEYSIPSSKENLEDNVNSQVIPTQHTLENVINEGESTIINDETKSTNLQSNKNFLHQENVVLSTKENPNLNIPVVDDENPLEPDTAVIKENDAQIPNAENVNDTKLSSQNTTEPGENQLATAATMSPDTQLSNDIRPSVTHAQPESTDPCAKVTDGKCTQEVKFVFNNQTLCFGSVYAVDWVVTSASCALRIFRAGMLNVIISPVTDMSKGHVKTIVVHESYAENSGTSGQGMEANNIGLVQLHTPMVEWSSCVPCLPEAGKEFTGVNCSAVTSQPLAPSSPRLCAQTGGCETARSESTVNTCEGPSRMMADDIGFSYITLNCDILWEPRFFDPSSRGSGAPLFCDGGVLAGVETGAGVGLMVYTPLTPYIPWLLKNTRPSTPEQTFNVG